MRDVNTSLSRIDMSSRQKLNERMWVPTEAINQVELMDIYRTFHINTKENASVSEAHGSFSKIYTYSNTKKHSTDTIKYKQSTASYHHGSKLDINNNRNNSCMQKCRIWTYKYSAKMQHGRN